MNAATTIRGLSAAVVISAFVGTPAALADTEMTDAWSIAEGGKLYDAW